MIHGKGQKIGLRKPAGQRGIPDLIAAADHPPIPTVEFSELVGEVDPWRQIALFFHEVRKLPPAPSHLPKGSQPRPIVPEIHRQRRHTNGVGQANEPVAVVDQLRIRAKALGHIPSQRIGLQRPAIVIHKVKRDDSRLQCAHILTTTVSSTIRTLPASG